ncbi:MULTISPECIES: hypothetical protein [unclassified Shewanella]|uniref:hypothetical protein n=1 Tax=unclassified Shewanella TaxID=196818 RepID=UPI001C7DB93A|nr:MULTISPECIES: hypothetical protein [unclassified Shewanella]
MAILNSTFVKSNEGVTVPDAVSWLFQSFKAKDSSKGPTEKNINSFGLRKKLCLLPKTSQKTVDNSTVLEDTIGVSKEEFSLVCKVKQYDLIRIMNNKTVLKQMISNGLLDDIKDLIDDELLL